MRNLSLLVSILITHTRSFSDLSKPGECARGAMGEGEKKGRARRGVGNGQKIGSSYSGQREKMAIPWQRASFIRYFITTSPTGRTGAIPAVLGGVFRGFAGGNQSGKKLNITPRSKGGCARSFCHRGGGNSASRVTAARTRVAIVGVGARYRDVRSLSLGPTGIQDK